MRTTISTLMILLALGASGARASEALSCSGDLTFMEGASTRISCTGDLWLGGGLTLVADESISVWAQTALTLDDVTLDAPSIFLSSGSELILSAFARITGHDIFLGTRQSTDPGQLPETPGAVVTVPGSDVSLGGTFDPRLVGQISLEQGGSIRLSDSHGVIQIASPVPEPEQAGLWLAGLSLLAALSQRRCRTRNSMA